MKILAFEFSAAQRAVAVLDAAVPPAAFARVAAEVVFTGGPAVPALGMAGEALRQAGLEREQIDTLVVGLGPGSYNGIRAALALARGWELAGRVRLIGFSTADALAFLAAANGLTGKLAVVIDAQRGEIYLGEYELTGGAVHATRPLRLAQPADALACEADGAILAGPEVQRWSPTGKILMPRAAALAEMAARGSPAFASDHLEPIYLRETSFVKAPPPRILPPMEP